MTYKIPSLSETRDFLLAVGKAVLPDRNFGSLRSYFGKRTTFLSAAVTQLHSHIDSVQKAVHPLTAGDGDIDAWGEVKGVQRKGATPARQLAAGRVIGANGTPVEAETELVQLESGLRFKIANSTTVPVGGYVDVDITAIDTGEQTRLLKGTVLRFVGSTPIGLQGQIALVKDLDLDGTNAEQFGSYRRRTLTAFSAESSGGSQSDYVKWALDKACPLPLVSAYAYPNRAGFGTVDIVGLKSGSGAERILSGGENAELLAFLKTKVPAHLAGTVGALRVLTVIADPQSVELVLTPNGESAYAFDWSSGPLTITAYNAVTREVTLSAALPSSMVAGHRVVFKGVATVQNGKEHRIEAISAADKFIIEAAPDVSPANTDLVYSGGPLVTPVRDAIVAHLSGKYVYAGKGGVPIAEDAVASTVGLEVLAEPVGPANPSGAFGTWIGGIIRGVLGGIAIHKAGVRNYAIALPLADYEATDDVFPNDGQIHMITASSVLVRGAT